MSSIKESIGGWLLRYNEHITCSLSDTQLYLFKFMFSKLAKKQDNVKEALIKQSIEGQMKEAESQRQAEVERLKVVAEKLKIYLGDEGIVVKDAVIVLEGLLQELKRQMGRKFQPVLDEWNQKTVKEFYAESTEQNQTA